MMDGFIKAINDVFEDAKFGVNILCYADDAVLIADTPEKLEAKINLFEEIAKSTDLRINFAKSF